MHIITSVIEHPYAAKKHFDALGLKKLPPIEVLRREYATIDAERKVYRGPTAPSVR